MSAGLSITPSSDRISAALRRATDVVPLLRAMGNTLLSITQGAFNSVGARFRPTSWAPLKDPPGVPSILRKSGQLQQSLHLTVTPTYAAVGSPMIYAAIHQLGGEIRPKNAKALVWANSKGEIMIAGKVTIPARPFFPVDKTGRLTPAADELIARAGERALSRQLRPTP